MFLTSFQSYKIIILYFSISPELEAKTQEVIHNRYGGRDRAEKAARVIQHAYRQYRLQQSFHKLRLDNSEMEEASDGEMLFFLCSQGTLLLFWFSFLFLDRKRSYEYVYVGFSFILKRH